MSSLAHHESNIFQLYLTSLRLSASERLGGDAEPEWPEPRRDLSADGHGLYLWRRGVYAVALGRAGVKFDSRRLWLPQRAPLTLNRMHPSSSSASSSSSSSSDR